MLDVKLPPKDTRNSRLQLCWHCLSWQSPCSCWKGEVARGAFVCGLLVHIPGEAPGWGPGIPRQVQNLHQLWWDLCCPLPPAKNVAGKCQLGRRSGRTSSFSPLPGPGDPAQRRELPEHLSRPAALSAWSSWKKKKKERDDVSVAEPTSNALNLAAVRTWGHGQARCWMQNAFKSRSKLDLNLILCTGGEHTHPLLRTAGGGTAGCWRWPPSPAQQHQHVRGYLCIPNPIPNWGVRVAGKASGRAVERGCGGGVRGGGW